MQCGIDCSTAVEFSTTIMLILLVGRWDFTDAGTVAMLLGKREGESTKRMGKFHLMHNLSGSSVALLGEQALWTSALEARLLTL
jgi:hypothetical protein